MGRLWRGGGRGIWVGGDWGNGTGLDCMVNLFVEAFRLVLVILWLDMNWIHRFI